MTDELERLRAIIKEIEDLCKQVENNGGLNTTIHPFEITRIIERGGKQ